MDSGIVSPFTRQIALGNAGPASALQYMGVKRSFRCHPLNIGLMYKQLARKGFVQAQKSQEG